MTHPFVSPAEAPSRFKECRSANSNGSARTATGRSIDTGTGSIGAAFFFSDHGTKHGHISLLGVLSCFARLLSTLLLIALGPAPLTPAVGIAFLLIVGGGLVASGVIRLRRPARIA